MKLKQKESQVQKAILDYLKLKRIFCWKQNNVGIMKANGSYIPSGMKGVADILGVLPGGRFLAIEVKASEGMVPSVDQQHFLNQVEIEGGKAFVASSLDDVISAGI